MHSFDVIFALCLLILAAGNQSAGSFAVDPEAEWLFSNTNRKHALLVTEEVIHHSPPTPIYSPHNKIEVGFFREATNQTGAKSAVQNENANTIKESAISTVKSPNSLSWHPQTAFTEVTGDIKTFLQYYDKQKEELGKIMAEFNTTRIKDSRIRKLANWGISFTRLYNLVPDHHMRAEIYYRARENAMRLTGVYTEMFSFVENTTMRGWPMYVSNKDAHPIFEAFNFGHIGMAVCGAARMDADQGHHRAAQQKVTQVLNALYDGFFTDDKEKTKVDANGWVVYVPASASDLRKERHIAAAEQKICLDVPQAYNHGIMVARAAMACDQAIMEIDWSKASWDMTELTLKQALKTLRSFIARSNDLLLGDLKELEIPSSRPTADMYPGKQPASFYQWKYRNLKNCPKQRDTSRYRFEDIAHGSYETNFFSEVFNGGFSQLGESDLRKLIITFLNRLVRSYTAPGVSRFACDVDGTHDESPNGPPGWPSKSCGNSRQRDARPGKAPQWLTIATSLRHAIESDGTLRCDVLLMVKTVMDLVLPGKDFDDYNFAKPNESWASHAIEAKYFYYNYDARFHNDCPSPMDPFLAGYNETAI